MDELFVDAGFEMQKRYLTFIALLGLCLLAIGGLVIFVLRQPFSRELDQSPVVTFAASQDEQADYKPLIDEFNRINSDYQIKFVPISSSRSMDIQDTAEMADVILLPGRSLEKGDGYFKDIEPLMEMDSGFSRDDYWPGVFEGCQGQDGRQLGIPLSLELSGIFLDSDAFSAAGLVLPGAGWTWEDFSKTLLALSRSHPDHFVFMDQSNLSDSILAPILSQAAGAATGSYDSTDLAAKINWYFATSIYPFEYGASNAQERISRESLFLAERPAMWVGSINASFPGGNGKALDTDRFVPFPIDQEDPDSGTTPVQVQCLALSIGSDQEQAAWAWMSYLSTQWGKDGSTDALAQFPARLSTADEARVWDSLPDAVEDSVRFILAHGWYGPANAQAFSRFEEGLYRVIAGKIPLATALDEILASSLIDTLPTANAASVVVATPPGNSSADSIELRFYGMGAKYANELENLAGDFEKDNPGVTILLQDLDGISPDPGQDPFTLATQQTDCFLMETGLSGDGVLSLNAFIDVESGDFVNDFYHSLNDARDFGMLYSLPAFSRPLVMYYNPDLLAQAGVTSPAESWTFDEFVKMLTTVASTRTDNGAVAFLFELGWSDPFFLAGRGVSAFDPTLDIPDAKFDTSEMANALTWLSGLQKSGAFRLLNSENVRQAEIDVAMGKVAFWIAPLGAPFSGGGNTFEPGVAPLPVTPIQNPLLDLGSEYGYYLSSQTAHPDACWRWIRYLSDHWTVSDAVPARRSLAASAAWENLVRAQNARVYRSALEQTTQGEQVGYNPVLDSLTIWQTQAVQSALAGELIPPVLAKFQSQAEAYLTCVRGLGLTEANRLSLRGSIQSCADQSGK